MTDSSKKSDADFQGLFEHSPLSLWVEDYSGVKVYLDSLRAQGVVGDIQAYAAEHPDIVEACMALI